MKKITTVEDLIACVNEYGILPFWDEKGFSSWGMSGVNFMKLWYLREKAVNSGAIVYGKFVNKKSTFVSKTVFPYLASLRRDGYDFDSLCDEGRIPKREADIMNAIGNVPAPSYELGKTLEIKGYDNAITALQNKTYLCVTFKKSSMGTAMLNRPEDVYGYDYVRSQYALSPDACAEKLTDLAKGLKELDERSETKLLFPRFN